MNRLADRAGAVGAELRMSALSTARRYVELMPAERPLEHDARAEVLELLEQLAVQWREAEDLWVAELGEEVLPAEAVMLLAALEDSLVLALGDEEPATASILTAEQAAERVEDLRGRGVWPGL